MRGSKLNTRIEKIADYTYNHLNEMSHKRRDEKFDLSYRWEHTLRVANYGKQIAEAEGAKVELVVAACLLHDISHFDTGDYKDHGRLSAQIARPYLEWLEYSKAEVNNICYSIAVHVDGTADFEHPPTLESQIVSDADNIDRFGAFRILQACAPDMANFQEMVNVLRERVVKLEKFKEQDALETATGRELFRQQLYRQILFYQALVHEGDLTVLPKI